MMLAEPLHLRESRVGGRVKHREDLYRRHVMLAEPLHLLESRHDYVTLS